MILCLIVVVIFAPVAATNAYANEQATQALLVIGVGMGIWWLIYGREDYTDNYLPDQEQDRAVEKHLDRLHAVSFTGPESQGRAEQQGQAGTNAGVTYTLFEW